MSKGVRESVAAYGATLRPMSVREYYLGAENGVFDPDEKLELIWGEVIKLSPQKSLHAWAIDNVADYLAEAFPSARLRKQMPLRLDNFNEPEPDLLVATGPLSRYAKRHPGAEDALLVVEISEASLRKDRKLKATLYATFGIAEYWIVDLKGERIEVYRQPEKSGDRGHYKSIEIFLPGQSITPLNAQGQSIPVSNLLPNA